MSDSSAPSVTVTSPNPAVEHALTLPTAVSMLASLLTGLTSGGLISQSSPWRPFLVALAPALPILAAQLGQLWQSLHVRTTLAQAKGAGPVVDQEVKP